MSLQILIFSGCADKLIRIFDTSGNLLRTIRDSPDIVRSLCKLPPSHPSGAQFASASNDGVIRLFTLQGQLVAELHGHENFIYSVASLPSGELVSSGEDRTVRVWNGTQCVQTITHPAISVWSVAACKENGDIVTGASDRITRVFTRSPERQAAPEVVQQFESSVKESAIPEQQVGKVNKEKLPGPEFLQQKLGTKDGQVQMIREADGSVTAHTWTAATQQWTAVGTVVDSAASSGRKTEYLGQDYDYVFDVDVEDGKPPLKLPYNVSQNPYDAATKFIQDNELPMSYLDQVANFIVQNTQGATLGQTSQEAGGPEPWGQERRYRPGDAEAAQQASIPESRPKVLPQKTFLSIKSANLKVISKKLGELNQQLESAGSKDLALSPSEMDTVSAMCSQLETSRPFKDTSLVESGIESLFKIATEWPPANRLPGLDLLRVLAAATPLMATMDYGEQDLISGIQSGGIFDPPINVNNAMLSVRMMANLFETEAGRHLAVTKFDKIIGMIQPALNDSGGAPNRNLTIAVATLYINYAVFSTSEGRGSSPESSERGLILVERLAKMLSDEKDSEAVYRSLVALGTLIKELGDEVRSAATEVYEVGKILDRISGTSLGKEPRVKGVIDEIKESIR